MKTKGHKIIEYTVLLLGVVVFSVLFYFFRYDRSMELILIAIAALFYAVWGLVHHAYEKRLNLEIALEYILISFFIFLLVLSALSV